MSIFAEKIPDVVEASSAASSDVETEEERYKRKEKELKDSPDKFER